MLKGLDRRYPRIHLQTAICLLLGLIALALFPDGNTSQQLEIPVSLAVDNTGSDQDSLHLYDPQFSEQPDRRIRFPIKTGDSLSTIFSRAGIPATSLHTIMSLGPEVNILKRILPGNELLLDISPEGELNSLQYEKGPLESIVVTRNNSRFEVQHQQHDPEVLETFRVGLITRDRPSLFESGKAAGLSDNIVMEMSYVFQWDISFALDLRQGDSFAILYEENYLEGEKVRDGDILSAEFTNLGKSYAAVLYVTEEGDRGYFTPTGESMRKAFLRDPVHFSRVSSSFNLRRLHPIHKKVMPHRGIDYAARTGTPVMASGDGKVSTMRQNSASGKYIVLQHGEQFTTKYLHLSNFAKGIRAGNRVKQGQVIGYVGATGWATAPHLHYEFLVNGVHRNPRTVKLPQSAPVPEAERHRFLSLTASYLERLEKLKQPPQLAIGN